MYPLHRLAALLRLYGTIHLLLILSFTLLAQKHDANWLFGRIYQSHSTTYPYYGTTDVSYNYTPAQLNFSNRPANFVGYMYNFSNAAGIMQTYSNGVKIFNRLNQVMENGDSINCCGFSFNGAYSSNTPSGIEDGDGYGGVGGMIALLQPNTDSILHILDSRHNPISHPNYVSYPGELLHNIIDLSKNNGFGKVIQKNKNIQLAGTQLNSASVVACRHANGRDYWVLTQDLYKCYYYKYLLTDKGLIYKGWQQPDPWYGNALFYDSQSQTAFNREGDKLANYDNEVGVRIYDFDRCTGDLNLKRTIPLDAARPVAGLAFSPNSRFLYYSNLRYLYQIDMQDNSIDTVGIYDGFTYSVPSAPTSLYRTSFFLAYTAPDDKIYINTYDINRYLHTIENPNLKGTACNFQQHSIFLPTFNFYTIPTYVNYRLGPLIGSGCDTLYSATQSAVAPQKSYDTQLFPNPASSNSRLVWYEPLREPATVQVINAIGQVVQSAAVNTTDTYLDMDIRNIPSGVYSVRLQPQGASAARYQVASLVVIR